MRASLATPLRQNADLLERAAAQARIGLERGGEPGLAAQRAADELVGKCDRQEQQGDEDGDPDGLIDQEGGQRHIAAQHAADDERRRRSSRGCARGRRYRRPARRRARGRPRPAFSRAAKRRSSSAKTRATARAKIARVDHGDRQRGGDGLVECLEHLADDHDRREGDGEAHDPRGGGIADRDQPPGGVVRRQDRVDQRAHEGDEGKAAQQGTRRPARAAAARYRRNRRRSRRSSCRRWPGTAPRSEHAERGKKAAAPCGIGDGGIALDEARRDRAPPDIERDRHADRETEKKQDAERSALRRSCSRASPSDDP